MKKDIIVIENFIENDLLKSCLKEIKSCIIKSSGEDFYMRAEDRISM
jgi:hypothetical protein